MLWTYCHPWEFDPDEAYHPHEHIGTLASRVAWLRRSRMERRFRRLLGEPVGPPLADRVQSLAAAGLPVVDPAQPPALSRAARLANGRLRSS